MASSVVRHLDSAGGLASNILIVAGVRVPMQAATRDCAVSAEWTEEVVVEDAREPWFRERLMNAVAGRPVQQVVVARNYMPANDIVLREFDNAEHIVYGDALGWLDFKVGAGLPRLDRIVTFVPQPMTPGIADHLALEVVDRAVLADTIAQVRARLPDLRAEDEALAAFARDGLLVLLSGLTEIGYASLKGELRADAARTMAVLSEGMAVVIKPHPRATLGQGGALARRLRARGMRVRVIASTMNAYPIELWQELLDAVKTVEATGSSSCIALTLLYGVNPVVRTTPARELKAIFPGFRTLVAASIAYQASVAAGIDRWDGRTPFMPPVRYHRPLWQRLTGAVRLRIFRWVATPSPSVHPRHEARLVVHFEHAAGIARGSFDVSGHEALADAAFELAEEAARREASRVHISAHGFPPTHVPAWQVWMARLTGRPFPQSGVPTMEQIEAALDSRFDVVARDPELATRRAVRAAIANDATELVCVRLMGPEMSSRAHDSPQTNRPT